MARLATAGKRQGNGPEFLSKARIVEPNLVGFLNLHGP